MCDFILEAQNHDAISKSIGKDNTLEKYFIDTRFTEPLDFEIYPRSANAEKHDKLAISDGMKDAKSI